jgi:UDP-N-acetylglucosamine acyltransferase
MKNKMKVGKNVKIGKNTIISKNVIVGDNVKIGNNVILEGNINIGAGTKIDHGVIIRGKTKIGKNNWIYPNCVFGTGPQHVSFKEKDIENSIKKFGMIEIGDDNIIREFTTIHLPTVKKKTIVGSNCYIMAYCHIAHDAIVHDSVILANKTTLSGHVEIFNHANLGLDVNIHQLCKIGAYSMIGMGNSISKDVLPFSLINKQEFSKINSVGLLRNKIKKSDIEKIGKIYKEKFPIKVAKEWYEKEIVNFMKKTTRTTYFPIFNKNK